MTTDTDRIARPTDEDGYYMVPCRRCREHYDPRWLECGSNGKPLCPLCAEELREALALP